MATKKRKTVPDSFGIKHTRDCPFLTSDEDLWVDCTCNPRFNEQPFSHWQDEAREIVVDWLLRSAINTDHTSIIGYMAKKRLIQIAEQESPEILERTRKQWKKMQANMNAILADFLLPPDKSSS